MITNLTKEECLEILHNNYVGHLAYIYKKSPFVIPVTYYFDEKNITVIGYTGEGHKTKALRLNNAVSLEIAEIQTIDEWKSILIHGTFEELEGPDAKYGLHKFSQGVKKLIQKKEKQELHFIPQFSGKTNSDALPIVYQINIQEITGKERKQKKGNIMKSYQKNKKILQ